MEKYLRFGEIPKNEKSINFMKLNFQQQEDFSYFRKNNDIEKALELIPGDAFEDGISVFEMDENGMPILNNLNLIKSFLSRFQKEKAFEVSGAVAGFGIDNEPLLKNVEVLKNRRLNKEKCIMHVLKILISNFKYCEKVKNASDDLVVYEFVTREKINVVTGEKVHYLSDVANPNEWVKLPEVTTYTFYGWEFSEPINNFKCEYNLK